MTVPERPTDSSLGRQILQVFYEQRGYGKFINPSTDWIDNKVSIQEVYRICTQLHDDRLIDWNITESGGCGIIKSAGVAEIEGRRSSNLQPQNNYNYTANISNSNNVVIGNHNVQAVQAAFDEIAKAIEDFPGAESDKDQAKKHLSKLLSSPVFAQLVGQFTRFGLEHLH